MNLIGRWEGRAVRLRGRRVGSGSNRSCSGPATTSRSWRRTPSTSGADVIGMAGGDGSQALVASVAPAAGVAVRLHPRRHAEPLRPRPRPRPRRRGRRPRRVRRRRRAAYRPGDGHRPASSSTTCRSGSTPRSCSPPSTATPSARPRPSVLPEMLGPDAPPSTSGSRARRRPVEGPDHQVSNNPYRLTRSSGVGSGPALDTGVLGIVTVQIDGATDVAELRGLAGRRSDPALPRLRGVDHTVVHGALRQPGRGRGRRRGAPARSSPRVPLPPGSAAGPGADRVLGKLTGGQEGPLTRLDGAGAVGLRRGPWPPGGRSGAERSIAGALCVCATVSPARRRASARPARAVASPIVAPTRVPTRTSPG